MGPLDFTAMITRIALFADAAGPLWTAAEVLAYVLALLLAMSALWQLKEIADDKRYGYKGPILTLVAAGMMGALPETIASLGQTIYGTDTGYTSALAYVTPGPSNVNFLALMKVISFIGYIFFMRGIWVVRQAGEPQRYQGASIGKAIAILAAAVCAIYIDVSIAFLAGTFGWDVSAYVKP